MSKRYVGVAEPGRRSVTVMDDQGPLYVLEPREARWVGRYVVDRWFWGDDGQESKALALGILLDLTGNMRGSRRQHLLFWRQVIRKLLVDRWSIDGDRLGWWFRQSQALSGAAVQLVTKAEEDAPADTLRWPWSQS